MAEPQTTPETQTAGAETPEAAAPPPNAAKGGLSFAERMAAQGWDPSEDKAAGDDDESDEETEGEEGAETTEETPAAPAAARPKVVEVKPENAELEQFRSLATKLGFELEDQHVVNRERAGFRQWKAKQTEGIEQHRQRVHGELGQLVQSAQTEIQFGRKAKELLDAGDFDGLAAHYGKKDWNDLNTHALTAASDPQWKANLENRREIERLRQEREQERQQYQTLQQQQQEQQVMQQWHTDLQSQMVASGTPVLAAFADDPMLRNAIIDVQRHYYHASGQSQAPLSPAQALKAKMPGANITLEQHLRGLKERLDKAFAVAPSPVVPAPSGEKTTKGAPATETPTETPVAKKKPNRPAPRTGVVNREDATNAGRRQGWDKEAWRAKVSTTLANAVDEDNARDRKR